MPKSHAWESSAKLCRHAYGKAPTHLRQTRSLTNWLPNRELQKTWIRCSLFELFSAYKSHHEVQLKRYVTLFDPEQNLLESQAIISMEDV